MDIAKQNKIATEINRISAMFTKMDSKLKNAVKALIENAAFMAVTLQELQDEINEKGVIEKYQNGANQYGVKKSSEVEVYNSMIKNYSSIIKQLTDLLHKTEQDQLPDDGFDAFLASRK